MVRFILIGFINAVIIIVCSALSILDIPLFQKGKFSSKIEKLWARLVLKASGVRVEVSGTEHINKNKSYIFIANHLSMFDIPATVAAIPNTIKMLTKKELFRIPLFGWALYAGRHIRIDRQKRESAIQSLDEAVNRIKKEDISVLVYAEGTRSPDGKIKTFKKGAFILGIKSGIPIVPVTIVGSREIVPKKSLKINRGTITIYIDNPVETKNLTLNDKSELLERVYNTIVERLEAFNN